VDYQVYYQESFEAASRTFDSDPYRVASSSSGREPWGVGQPSSDLMTRKMGGWFGGGPIPDLPRDDDVVSRLKPQRVCRLAGQKRLPRPDAWYMNHERTANSPGARSPRRSTCRYFSFTAASDFTWAETVESRLASRCARLPGPHGDGRGFGHWMAQEKAG